MSLHHLMSLSREVCLRTMKKNYLGRLWVWGQHGSNDGELVTFSIVRGWSPGHYIQICSSKLAPAKMFFLLCLVVASEEEDMLRRLKRYFTFYKHEVTGQTAWSSLQGLGVFGIFAELAGPSCD